MIPFMTPNAYADHSINIKDLPDQIIKLPPLTQIQQSITYAGRGSDEPERG